ncbi:MAG: hypothetical protein V7K25_31505 [Nostoc sp.]
MKKHIFYPLDCILKYYEMTITQLITVFEVYDDEQQAIASFS